ncbi:MAG: basic secretory protein-like protein [Planctomycetota bacterium]|nr:basic secretory protein-like protein [Planctomycetota bacterium]
MPRIFIFAAAIILTAAPALWAADAVPAAPKPVSPVPIPPEVPPVAVESTMPTSGDHVPDCAYDGKADAYFLSAQAPKTGDTFTLTLGEPAAIKRIEVQTGDADGKNAVAGAVLETSADGKEFSKVAAFASGAAKAATAAKPVKTIRIRFTADAAGPVAIREFVLDAQPPIPVIKYPLEVRLDCSAIPDMKDWCEKAAKAVERWWPTFCDYLASDGFVPAKVINIKFLDDNKGIAATGGNNITCHMGWFKAHPDDIGAIVHESIHVIQAYHSRSNPGWLVEGLDDYLRWWIYETHPPKGRLDPNRIKYTDSYQTTGAFLDWAVKNTDKDLVRKLNAACRKGEYKEELFKTITGKDLNDLFEEFKKSLAKN